MFEIPVVLFIFKRDKAVKIIEQIAKVKPKKIYLLADYGRNDEEKAQCDNLRKKVEEVITWDCEVIKNYAKENRGVFQNIGLGAKWVFEHEEKAIFLEDDNLPDITFFQYCEDMLNQYEHEEKILWICGTNYLINYENNEHTDIVFTRHMLPCGWASWSKKFNKYYDGYFCNLDKADIKRMNKLYPYKELAYQFNQCWNREMYKISKGRNPASWDYQMDFTLKYYDLYGIAPCVNLITNIGVDEDSIHGGTSMNNKMTERFCENKTIPMTFPIKTPAKVQIDNKYEKKVGKIILLPFNYRLKGYIVTILRKLFKIPYDVRIKEFFLNK